nr:hypothetical protein [Sporosarcina ureilytica]
MKRFVVLLLLLSLMGACSSEQPTKNAEDGQGMEVEKGLLNVEVTLPPLFFEGENIDEVIANAKAEGIKDVKKNEDGSLTYKMSKAKHKEMLDEMKDTIIEQVNELETGEDFPSIQTVSYHKAFKEFTLQVDKEQYENSFDGLATIGLGLVGVYYQVLDGTDIEQTKVMIHLEDAATGEVFDSMVYPDALDE